MSQTTATQIPTLRSRIGAMLRATSGNFLEQYDFFLFGFYAQRDRQGVLSLHQRDRIASEHVRRVLARRADAPRRRDRARRLHRPDRPAAGTDRDARNHGCRNRGDRILPELRHDRHCGADHRAARPAAAGLFRRRRAGRRLGLSVRDRNARQPRLLHLVPVLEPAGCDLRRRHHRLHPERSPCLRKPSRPGAGASPSSSAA